MVSDGNGSAVLGQAAELLAPTQLAGLVALLVAVVAMAGIIFVWRRLRRIQADHAALGTALTGPAPLGSFGERQETLEVSRSATALLDQFRRELAAHQCARGADAAVIERLDGAVALLREHTSDPAAGLSQAGTLQSVAQEIREMRLAYASTSRSLEQATASLAVPARRVETTPPRDADPEYDAVARIARRAVATFECDAAEAR